MNNYTKGKNVEEAWDRRKIPIEDLPEGFVWMQVSAGSKIRNLMQVALEKLELDSPQHIVWSASGSGITKAISCAEICKKKFKLNQKTQICYRKVKEYWDPKIPNLDRLVVIREVPTIHIYLYRNQD